MDKTLEEKMNEKFEKKARLLFDDMQYYCTEDKQFILRTKSFRNGFINMLKRYIDEFEELKDAYGVR